MPTLMVTSCACAAPAMPAMAAETSSVRLSVIRFFPCLFRLDEIAAFGVAIEAAIGVERLERAHDLAAIAAADRGHQLLEGFRAVGECRRDRGKALPGEARRLRHARL